MENDCTLEGLMMLIISGHVVGKIKKCMMSLV